MYLPAEGQPGPSNFEILKSDLENNQNMNASSIIFPLLVKIRRENGAYENKNKYILSSKTHLKRHSGVKIQS